MLLLAPAPHDGRADASQASPTDPSVQCRTLAKREITGLAAARAPTAELPHREGMNQIFCTIFTRAVSSQVKGTIKRFTA